MTGPQIVAFRTPQGDRTEVKFTPALWRNASTPDSMVHATPSVESQPKRRAIPTGSSIDLFGNRVVRHSAL